jgi:putative endonuclease
MTFQFGLTVPPFVILGLVPRTQGAANSRAMVSTQQRYWTYILASQPRGTLYIGVTNNILGRVELHRAAKGSGFTSKYGVAMLVWFEEFDRIDEAIQREKSLKRYLRQWKFNLIEQSNPQWLDLYSGLGQRNKFGEGSKLRAGSSGQARG